MPPAGSSALFQRATSSAEPNRRGARTWYWLRLFSAGALAACHRARTLSARRTRRGGQSRTVDSVVVVSMPVAGFDQRPHTMDLRHYGIADRRRREPGHSSPSRKQNGAITQPRARRPERHPSLFLRSSSAEKRPKLPLKNSSGSWRLYAYASTAPRKIT